MEPCSEKENIEKLFRFHDEKMNKLHDMELRQIAIAGDIVHMKGRIDNGMSHTLEDIRQKVTDIVPILEHHSSVINRIEDMGWLLSRWVTTGLVISLLGIIVWAISKGFMPK